MGSKRVRRRQLKLATVDEVPSRVHDASKGTPTYAYNQFRSNMLTSLLNDLITLENDGLAEDTCMIVQRSLGYFVNATTDVPAGGMFTGALSPVAQEFEETYKSWNGINGTDDEAIKERRKHLVKLRGIRQKLTNRTRKLQFELSNDLDVAILKSGYEAIGELVTTAPNVFGNLVKQYGNFVKKGGLEFA